MQIKAATNQPPYSRGEFDFSGNYTSIPNALDASTGAAQFVLIPATVFDSFHRAELRGRAEPGFCLQYLQYRQPALLLRSLLAGRVEEEPKVDHHTGRKVGVLPTLEGKL